MSFGFSVGDIILLSQLSYSLYGTLTSGRRNASRELKELEHVLFGLRCALDHLRHVAGDISKTAAISASSDSHGREMQQELDQMIQNCAITLEDLDNATKKYRDGATVLDNEGGSGSGEGCQKRRLHLKNAITSNWAKIRWDMDKGSLKTYRDRLQSHVDAINLVLSTFHWSATEKIHAHNKTQAEKLQEFQEVMVKSNSSLAHLLEVIHSMLSQPKQTAPVAFPRKIDDRIGGLDGFLEERPTMRTGGVFPREIQSVAAHRAPRVMFNAISTGASTAASAIPSVPPGNAAHPYISAMSFFYPIPPSSRTKPRLSRKELPPKIISINIKRQREGAKALSLLRSSLIPTPRPSFLDPIVPTVTQLSEGLDHIFLQLQRSTGQQLEIARQTRTRELGLWIQSLNHLMDSLTIPLAGFAGGSNKLTVSKQGSDLVNLLSRMNQVIETSSANMRDIAYEAFSVGHIDRTFDKVLSLTSSVRAQKEIEEFKEERSAWLSAH